MIKYHVENLSCANCAAKIETQIKKLEGVHDANLNLMSDSLIVETDMEEHKLLPIVQRIADEIEPGTKIHLIHEEHHHESDNLMWIEMGIGILLFILGLANVFGLKDVFFVAAFLVSGYRVLRQAGKNILKLNFFDEYFLMSIATLGALAIGENLEAAAVMLFYNIGETLQHGAVHRSKQNILNLMDTSTADVFDVNKNKAVHPNLVKVGDRLRILPGEKIQLDGHIVLGETYLDTKVLTGESNYRRVKIEDQVLSSMINQDSMIEMVVDKAYDQSVLAQMVEMLENAPNKKADTEKVITKFAKIYTPIVVLLALIIAFVFPHLFPSVDQMTWIHRSLIFLVASCPCALVVSVPLSYFAGLGKASREQILIKSAQTLEEALKIKKIYFDKTGTITQGNFNVVEFSNPETLYYAALLEQYSNHPISKAILNKNTTELSHVVTRFLEIAGQGLTGKIDGQVLLVGNEKLMQAENIPYTKNLSSSTIVYVALDKQFLGSIVIEDELKPSSIEAIQSLKSEYQLGLISGDNTQVVESIAHRLGIHEYYGELYPQDKLKIVHDQTEYSAFVGDGINDALVLQQSHIGFAMGELGSDIAIEAADVVIANDDLNKIKTFFDLSKKTKSIVLQNIALAIIIKVIVLVLGTLGYSNMLMAVFADVGVTLLAVLNALRLMR